MKKTLLLIAVAFISINLAAQDRLTADTSKTQLQWKGEKVLGEHTGTIKLKSGWLNWQENKIISGEFIIDMASLKESKNTKKLETHLKSEDFFGVEKFPVSKLVITGSTSFATGTATVSGNLTIKDITNPVEFKATTEKKDDGQWYYAKIIIDRTKYNIRYGSGSFFENLGDKTIYDDFEVKVNLLMK
jgi:polyisoprenoid-binding protein YceI